MTNHDLGCNSHSLACRALKIMVFRLWGSMSGELGSRKHGPRTGVPDSKERTPP